MVCGGFSKKLYDGAVLDFLHILNANQEVLQDVEGGGYVDDRDGIETRDHVTKIFHIIKVDGFTLLKSQKIYQKVTFISKNTFLIIVIPNFFDVIQMTLHRNQLFWHLIL